jgi:hypothetical protein
MSKNRGDLVAKLTDMLVDIGLALSRVEVLVKLFPTTRMVELTSRLYSAVLEFLEEIIVLFQRNVVRKYNVDGLVTVCDASGSELIYPPSLPQARCSRPSFGRSMRSLGA